MGLTRPGIASQACQRRRMSQTRGASRRPPDRSASCVHVTDDMLQQHQPEERVAGRRALIESGKKCVVHRRERPGPPAAPADVEAAEMGTVHLQMHVEMRDVVEARPRFRHREIQDRHGAAVANEYIGGTEIRVDRDQPKGRVVDTGSQIVESRKHLGILGRGEDARGREGAEPNVEIVPALGE